MRKYILLFLMTACCLLHAQTWQAEQASYSGTLDNGVVWFYTDDTNGYVQFTISATTTSSVTVYVGVQSPYGDKQMDWQVGGQSGTYQLTQQSGTYEVNLGTFTFNAGNTTIRISPNWTWFGVDYIRLTGLNGGVNPPGPTPTPTPTGGFTVSGNQLLDGYGQPFRMMGANLAYAWFKGYGYTRQMQAMKRAGANAVRIAVSDGGQYTKDGSSTLQGLISQAESLQMVLVLEVHDHTGSDESGALQAAAAYWAEMKETLKGHEHSVIINIANEWMGTWRQYNTYADAYATAISTIRNAGLNHCLMVDASGWGQEVTSLTLKAQTILNSDPNRNVMFSIHMYEVAGASGKVQSNINNVLAQGVALCIGEFAWAHKGEDVDEDLILSYTREKGVGWFAWSWWGNGGGLGYIDMVTNQYDETSTTTQTVGSMSCNWGQKVMNAWAAQAEVCTVYTGAPSDISEQAEDKGVKSKWYYDLLGRPVAVPQPGHIYIHDGQKIIIR